MKKGWITTLFASVPLVASMLVLASCGGSGGPVGGNGGQGAVNEQFLALMSDEQRAATSIKPEACAAASCHDTGSVDSPLLDHWKGTVHSTKGVTCENCHGPGSAHQANPTKTNILTFPKLTNPVVCAQCHGKISEQYSHSGHSGLIADPINSAVSNPAGAAGSRCVLCHSGLFRNKVSEQGIDLAAVASTDVLAMANDTLNTVPFIATCVTCHNPHKQTGNLDGDGEEHQLRHPVFNVDTTAIAPGTTAASFTTYNQGCGECHNGRGTNPSDTTLNASTSRPPVHYSDQTQMLLGLGGVEGSGLVQRTTSHAQIAGQCSTCHMGQANHTMVSNTDTSCSPCHTGTDAANRMVAVQGEVMNSLSALKRRLESWATTKYGNSSFWDYTTLVTGGTAPAQSGVPIEVKRTRYNYYYIVRSGDYGVHNAVYTRHLITVANTNLTNIAVPAAVPQTKSVQELAPYFKAEKARAMQMESGSAPQ